MEIKLNEQPTQGVTEVSTAHSSKHFILLWIPYAQIRHHRPHL